MLVYRNGPVEIWNMDGEFFVYGVLESGDPRVTHSLGAARAIAASGEVR